mmetsp:Transcript_3985/g.8209  ORF Transcript_3985/g.8209 Transcript_3985/m.8209 type:complete len:258 (+) Transcript_3985:277-1050(+)
MAFKGLRNKRHRGNCLAESHHYDNLVVAKVFGRILQCAAIRAHRHQDSLFLVAQSLPQRCQCETALDKVDQILREMLAVSVNQAVVLEGDGERARQPCLKIYQLYQGGSFLHYVYHRLRCYRPRYVTGAMLTSTSEKFAEGWEVRAFAETDFQLVRIFLDHQLNFLTAELCCQHNKGVTQTELDVLQAHDVADGRHVREPVSIDGVCNNLIIAERFQKILDGHCLHFYVEACFCPRYLDFCCNDSSKPFLPADVAAR